MKHHQNASKHNENRMDFIFFVSPLRLDANQYKALAPDGEEGHVDQSLGMTEEWWKKSKKMIARLGNNYYILAIPNLKKA